MSFLDYFNQSLLFTSLFMNNLFCLGLAHLLNNPKTKAQTWFIYKQTNIKKTSYRVKPKLFINSLVYL